MERTEVFFRIKALIEDEWVVSTTTYRTHKEAKADAEVVMGFAPNEYKIIRCERKVV